MTQITKTRPTVGFESLIEKLFFLLFLLLLFPRPCRGSTSVSAPPRPDASSATQPGDRQFRDPTRDNFTFTVGVSNATIFDPLQSDPLNIMGFVGALFIVMMIVFGSTGNLMVLVVIVKFPRLKKSYNTFIASLSATDLLFNVLIMPFFADSYLHRGWRFSMEFCRFHAFFGTTLVMCSSLHVALIAMNRYFLVVHASWYPKVSRTKVLVFQIALVWIMAISSVVPGALGWKALVQYTDQIGRCTYVRSESKESLDLVFILGFILPCIIVFFCYALIWLKSRRSKKRLRSYGISNDQHHHHRFQNQEMSFLEWLSSKIESNHFHSIHHLQGFPIKKTWRHNYFFHFRHSLPSALEETNFDEHSSIPLNRIDNRSNIQETLPSLSEDTADNSSKKVIFTCGEDESQIETPTMKLESAVESAKPVVSRGTSLAMRVIKSYVRKKSENDLLRPIKSCSSCPELYDLRKTHFIIPMLVISPDSGNSADFWGRKVSELMVNENRLALDPRQQSFLTGNESPDLSIINRNPDCFGCLKIKKDVKAETGQCPCKVRFAVLENEDQNDNSFCNDNLSTSQQRVLQKESTEETCESSEVEICKSGVPSNTGISLLLPYKTPSSLEKCVSSRSSIRISHPTGNRVSDLSGNVLPSISILANEMEFPVLPGESKQRSRNNLGHNSKKEEIYLKKHHRKRHSTKIILTIFFAFVFTYLPFTVVNLADDKGELSRNWYMITSLGFWAGSCLNPYIYGAMNDQFRSAYCSILNSIINFVCRKNRIKFSVGK